MLFALFLMFALHPHPSSAQISGPVRVETGLLSGVPGSVPGVMVFKGVPFAAPPVGDLRWRAPQPSAQWDGVRKADQFGPGCIQKVVGSRPPWTEEFMHQGPVSEDCLYLNVWTAAKSADERRPVLVYIHGGGFNEGSGSVLVYNGENLAKKGLVVVTVNYRMGVLGFFAHPALTAESGHNSSGNYGLLDQIAALRWVKDNIAAFGGDPNRVTVSGQSAGAFSVEYLTASPLAKGLFQRAIVESGPEALFGSYPARASQTLADLEQAGLKFGEAKGAHSIQELRAMSPDQVTAPVEGRFRFWPIVDGWVLPAEVSTVFAERKQNDVPTLTGMNSDEGSASPTYGKVKADDFREQAHKQYGAMTDTFLKLYPASTDAESGLSEKAVGRDRGIAALEAWAVDRAKTAKTNAYVYYFDRAIPWPEHPEFAAFHTSEVPYVFDNLNLLNRPWEAVDRKLADEMSSYWVNFAATGNPNGGDLPAWPAYRGEPGQVMELGAHIGPRELLDSAKRAFYHEQFAKLASE